VGAETKGETVNLLKLIGPIAIGGICGIAEAMIESGFDIGWTVAATTVMCYIVGYVDRGFTQYLISIGRA
jgi:hypothetical protein